MDPEEVISDIEEKKLLCKYEIRVYEGSIEIDGHINGVDGYLRFREATVAAEKAILREVLK